MTPLLELHNINCRYEDQVIIDDLSFSVAEQQIVSLLGPSGCGKTTALRAIAGLESIHAGRIVLGGTCLSEPGTQLPPEQRQVGMVFQDYALFPHLTVHRNISFGLHGRKKEEIDNNVDQLLALVRLQGHADKYPHQLSGGQQQRVALARALAPEPRILLLDEPFSNLDTEMRRSLSHEVREILNARKISAILVTHDQEEAFAVGDETGIMLKGSLQQWGNANDLTTNPANAFVSRFLGGQSS
jgi:iron(III) transport system ATP-binding protein